VGTSAAQGTPDYDILTETGNVYFDELGRMCVARKKGGTWEFHRDGWLHDSA